MRNQYELAQRLGMPPWKVTPGQARPAAGASRACGRRWAWSPSLNADVKGAAVDPDYALERAVRSVVAAAAGPLAGETS